MHTGSVLERHFRRHRKRLTPQRALICRLLEGTSEHPSAEVLHRRAQAVMPTLSLRTVYAILHELVGLRAVQPLDVGTGSTRYCPDPRRHNHAVCGRCGRVFDVDVAIGPIEIPPDQRRGFRVQQVQLIFLGVCRECRR